MSRIARNALGAAATLAATLALTGVAEAKVYEATGTANGDKETEVALELDAKAKQGALTKANSIESFTVENYEFECSATGVTGRASTPAGFAETVKIKKNGKFSTVHEVEAGGRVINRYTVSGKITGKGKAAVISGEYKVERSEGGLEFNNCSSETTAFKAKAKL